MDSSPPGSSVHGDSPDKNIGVGFHALLQGTFPTQGLNLGLPYCRWILYCLSYQESPNSSLVTLYSIPRRSWPCTVLNTTHISTIPNFLSSLDEIHTLLAKGLLNNQIWMSFWGSSELICPGPPSSDTDLCTKEFPSTQLFKFFKKTSNCTFWGEHCGAGFMNEWPSPNSSSYIH